MIIDLGAALEAVSFPSANELLGLFEKETKLPFVFSRGSGLGWSYWSTLQRCPREFYLTYVKPVDTESLGKPYPLEIGSYYHAFQALSLSEDPVPTPTALRKFLFKHKANPETVGEAWRVFEAYLSYYGESDYLEPLAIEYTAHHKRSNFSCRYDLIARVSNRNHDLIQQGVYIVERKTAAAFTVDVIDGWDLDGEVLGQMLLWDRCGLSKKFGPLRGVIVDIVGKQKEPKFHRTVVSKDSFRVRRHLQALNHMKAERDRYVKLKKWPMYTANCIRRYGRCPLYDVCRSGEK